MNKRYGLKEVANVIFFDVVTNKPVIFFDTLKVSTIENESESAEARGGQGNNKLLSWDYGRTASLTMSDALLSDISLAMLAGTEVQRTGIRAVGRETPELTRVDAGADATPTYTATLADVPVDNGTLTVYNVSNGVITDEIPATDYDVADNEISGLLLEDGESVMVFYEYDVTSPDASKVTFSGRKFPSTYRVVGETYVREQSTGLDRKMQFHIGKAKMQSTFSLTMDVENVSTFDFNLEVLVDGPNADLYDIIRL